MIYMINNIKHIIISQGFFIFSCHLSYSLADVHLNIGRCFLIIYKRGFFQHLAVRKGYFSYITPISFPSHGKRGAGEIQSENVLSTKAR